ncbi:monocarboxylate transporter 9 [Phlebotomus argentipes]|uniref:monocarboxylate transporter 9 n=1 Tax=Phlebotomus argentipes TaxID=94469 RepID=UPI002892AA18|nr:monocarboxylate transporter 9 [Phlebotomus argentipes]
MAKYRKVTPEGGWGYIVGLGLAASLMCALGTLPSFGLMFGDFLKDLGEETSAIALITSCFFSSFSIAGLFTNTLFKKYSVRKIALAGAFLYVIGSVMVIFVTTVTQLLVSFSVVQGIGFGLIIPSAYTTFNLYFKEKRVFIMSIAQTLIGLGSMIYPIVIQWLMDNYGFRGCMAIMAALNGHAIVGMLVMHPVEWHMRKVKVEDSEAEGARDYKIPRKGGHEDEDVTVEKLLTKTPVQQIKDEEEKVKSRRASSIPSLGNWTGPIVISDASERDKRPAGKWQVLVDFLDLTLMTDLTYVNIVLGISFALFSDNTFFAVLPMYLFELNFSKQDAAKIIAIGAAADLISRTFLALASTCIKVKSRYVYMAGAAFTVAARFAHLCVFDFNGMAFIIGIMGFLRTWIHVTLPLVFAEHLPQERFPSGYGLFMAISGFIGFVVGPISGYIRDATRSYPIFFHSLNLCMALCAVPWILEVLYLKFLRRKPADVPSVTVIEMEERPVNGN